MMRRKDGMYWVKRGGGAVEVMQRKGAWLKPKKGGKSLRAGPVDKVKEEKKTRKTIGKRKKVGVEAVSQEERVDIAATKEDEKKAQELLRKAKSGGRPTITLASAWKDEKGWGNEEQECAEKGNERGKES